VERIVVVFNPHAGSAERAAIEDALCGRAVCELVETDAAGAARRIAHEAALTGCGTIVAAGGDGTISEVVDGVVAAGACMSTRLAIVPLGTGNDLARTLAIPSSPAEALSRSSTTIARASGAST
jgi:diacylglycerol kinase (ATP)